MDFLQDQIDRGFAEFKGARVSGKLCVADSLVNELIADYLSNALQPQGSGVNNSIPFVKMVKSVTVSSTAGRMNINIEGAI
jgi:hypothetical protein